MVRFPVADPLDQEGASGANTVAGSALSAVIDLKATYGAKFDGVTDDTAAWQAAINAVKAEPSGGSWIHVPPVGVSLVSSTIDCTRLSGCTISARAQGGYEVGPEIRFTGATGPMFAFYGADGIVLDGLWFTCTNAAFTGDLIAFDWPASGGGQDCIYNRIEKCAFKSKVTTINSLLRMNKTIITTVKECHFWGPAYANILFGNNAASPPANQNNQYVNVVKIEDCAFNSGVFAHILVYCLDGEEITIRDNAFEGSPGFVPLPAPTAVAATPVVGGGGGAFAAGGTFFWEVTALNLYGETTLSNEATAVIAANGSCNLSWTAPAAPGDGSHQSPTTGYKIYRSSSSGAENTSPALVATIGSAATVTYTDTGTATAAGAVPAVNTTGGGGAIAGPVPNSSTFSHINIEDNWFGDATAGNVPWINFLRSSGVATGQGRIVGNQMFNAAVSNIYPCIAVDGAWLIETNYMEQPIGAGIAGGGSLSPTMIANAVNTSVGPLVAAPALWRVQTGVSYGVPVPLASAGDPTATVTWSTFPVGALGGRGLVLNTVYAGAGAAQARYMGTITGGAPTDSRQHSNLWDWFGPDSNGHFWVCTAAGTPGTWIRSDLGMTAAPAYSASITPSVLGGRWQTITVTNAAAFTINAPTTPPASSQTEELTIEVLNSSGGVMGAITWNAAFVFAAGAWANPASTKRRFARFEWNGANWIATSVASADY